MHWADLLLDSKNMGTAVALIVNEQMFVQTAEGEMRTGACGLRERDQLKLQTKYNLNTPPAPWKKRGEKNQKSRELQIILFLYLSTWVLLLKYQARDRLAFEK